MKTPQISILIANYNNGHFFNDCFKSLVAQTNKNWEAIVIDDCSTDNSVEVITELIKNDDRFKFYQNKENLGYQKTLIKAIDLSTADIWGRLDPDDALMPKAIELSIKAHQDFLKAGLVYSNFILCDEHLKHIYNHKAKQINELNESYYNFEGEIGHFATFKKSIYNKTSGIDIFNKKAEDKDIYMKMCEVAPVKHIDKFLYLYREHKGGVSTGENSEKAFFWHWVALIKMAERRNIDIENLFVATFKDSNKHKIELLKKSRWMKLGTTLGLFKGAKYL